MLTTASVPGRWPPGGRGRLPRPGSTGVELESALPGLEALVSVCPEFARLPEPAPCLGVPSVDLRRLN